MMTGHLFRYTELPYFLHMLRSGNISLLSYLSWEDKNDIHYLEEYARRKGISVHALCFTGAPETFHHWKIFSQGSSGIRLTFRRDELEQWVNTVEGLSLRDVSYYELADIRNNPPPIDMWPYAKRYPYKDEKEVRLLHEGAKIDSPVIEFQFDLSLIRRITLSPWLPKSVSLTVKDALYSIRNGAKFELSRTTLISNDEWMSVTKKHA